MFNHFSLYSVYISPCLKAVVDIICCYDKDKHNNNNIFFWPFFFLKKKKRVAEQSRAMLWMLAMASTPLVGFGTLMKIAGTPPQKK